MKAELKIFNELIETIIINSENNTAKITDVKLWADSWRKEMNLAMNYTPCCTELKCEGCKRPLNSGPCGSCCTDLASGMY